MASAVSYICCSCEKETATRRSCGRCKARNYCSTDCQRVDWLRGHRSECRLPVQAGASTLRALQVVYADTLLMQTLSMIVYGIMREEDGPTMRCLVLVVVNRPWERVDVLTNYCPLLFCVVQEVSRDELVRHATVNLVDTGQAALLSTPHKIPLLVLRSLDARLLDARHVEYTCNETMNIYPWVPSNVARVERSGPSVMGRTKHVSGCEGGEDAQGRGTSSVGKGGIDQGREGGKVAYSAEECRLEGIKLLRTCLEPRGKDLADFTSSGVIMAFAMVPGRGKESRTSETFFLRCLPHFLELSRPSLRTDSKVVHAI
jgi:hypothetical protein